MSSNRYVIFFYLILGRQIPMHKNMNSLLLYSETLVLYCTMLKRNIRRTTHAVNILNIKYTGKIEIFINEVF